MQVTSEQEAGSGKTFRMCSNLRKCQNCWRVSSKCPLVCQKYFLLFCRVIFLENNKCLHCCIHSTIFNERHKTLKPSFLLSSVIYFVAAFLTMVQSPNVFIVTVKSELFNKNVRLKNNQNL